MHYLKLRMNKKLINRNVNIMVRFEVGLVWATR